MIRFLLRTVALLILAGAFVALVLDGTRSIAASGLALMDVATLLGSLAPRQLAALQPAAEQLHPLAWDPVLANILKLPSFLVLAVLGTGLLRLTRPPQPKIGFSSRP